MALAPIKTDAPPDQQALGEQVKQLDEELAELRARFDQFFLGLEKRNPQKSLDDYRTRIHKLKREFIRNTGLKFRVQSLFAKFQSFERLWLKTLKEIEEGTYARDLFKLRRKKGQPEAKKADQPAKQGKEEAQPKKDPWDLDDIEVQLPEELFDEPGPVAPQSAAKPAPRQPAVPAEAGGAGRQPWPPSLSPTPPNAFAAPARPAARQATPPPPPPGAFGAIPRQPSKPPGALPTAGIPRQPSPGAMKPAGAPPRQPSPGPQPTRPASGAPVSAEGGLSSDKVRMIYDAYVTAKKRCKESTEGITIEAVEQSLRRQVPQLIKDHGAKSVDFKVVIKDGKAVLKAVPK